MVSASWRLTLWGFKGLRYLKLTSYPSEKIGRSPFSHGGISSSFHSSGGLHPFQAPVLEHEVLHEHER